MADIYLAGALFSLGERRFNAELARELREKGHNVFLPQEHEPAGRTDAKAIAVNDAHGVWESTVIVAILDGTDPDSGTAMECGLGKAWDKKILGVRTDFRKSGDNETIPVNLMFTLLDGFLYYNGESIEELATEVHGWICSQLS